MESNAVHVLNEYLADYAPGEFERPEALRLYNDAAASGSETSTSIYTYNAVKEPDATILLFPVRHVVTGVVSVAALMVVSLSVYLFGQQVDADPEKGFFWETEKDPETGGGTYVTNPKYDKALDTMQDVIMALKMRLMWIESLDDASAYDKELAAINGLLDILLLEEAEYYEGP